MIKPVPCYTVICDGCGKDYFDNDECEYSGFNEGAFVIDMAKEDNWIDDETLCDTHYCPDCYSYDDDDNLVINDSKKVKPRL